MTVVPNRDLSVDLVRVLCLLAVVAIHTAMVGIGGQGGELELSNPLTGLWFFAVGTWLGQVMPLFFLLGGFGAYMAMSRRSGEDTDRRSGESDEGSFGEHLRRRTLRLGLPAAVFYSVVAVVALILLLAGSPPEMLDSALEGAGDPLWFMAAFLICQGFVRAQHRLVVSGGPRRLCAVAAATVAGIVCIDAVRLMLLAREGLEGGAVGVVGTTGTPADALGLLNMWLLWPLLQLIGMLLAHGSLSGVRAWAWAVTALCSFAATAALATWAPYPTDMLMNLNPPTLPLLTIGLTHLALFQLLRPVLGAAAVVRPIQGVMALVASRAMHLYLWHMTVIILLNGLLWLSGVAPEPGEPTWWWTRIPLYLLAVGLTLGLTWPLGALERVRPVGRLGRAGPLLGWAALYVAVAPNLVVTHLGLTSVTVWIGAVLMVVGVVLAAAPRVRGRRRVR
ncbi:acyltransferase [Nesterenkonia marinintestina]|uniref:acyltransferase n=1 Tax=Nesterenkonia marinintestina TaxID=2979865 RepID=UPI0021C13CA7|nr:acyltransferase [Nesterenkonia sp. GX14115]